jgi:hypothetical protein
LHSNTSMSVTGRSPEGILWIGGETKFLPQHEVKAKLSGRNDPAYKASQCFALKSQNWRF